MLMCCIFPLLTERKKIHRMIDVFVFMPFTREKKKVEQQIQMSAVGIIKRLWFLCMFDACMRNTYLLTF